MLHIYEYFILFFFFKFNERHSLQIQPSFLAPRGRSCLKGKFCILGPNVHTDHVNKSLHNLSDSHGVQDVSLFEIISSGL